MHILEQPIEQLRIVQCLPLPPEYRAGFLGDSGWNNCLRDSGRIGHVRGVSRVSRFHVNGGWISRFRVDDSRSSLLGSSGGGRGRFRGGGSYAGDLCGSGQASYLCGQAGSL